MRNSPTQSDGGGGGGGDLGELLRNMGREELVIEARSRAVVEGVVQAAMDSHLKKRDEQKTTSIRRWSCDMNCWQYLGSRPIRPISRCASRWCRMNCIASVAHAVCYSVCRVLLWDQGMLFSLLGYMFPHLAAGISTLRALLLCLSSFPLPSLLSSIPSPQCDCRH